MAYPKPGLEIKGAPVSSVWIIMGKRKATQMAIPNIKGDGHKRSVGTGDILYSPW